MPRITLIGYRGTGKSTVAAILSHLLGVPWCDADIRLEEKRGCSITTLIREQGQNYFRDEESLLLKELLVDCAGVLATGGGVVLRQHNRELLHSAGRPTVWPTASAEVVRSRLALDPTTAQRRPALSGTDPLAEVASALEAREPLYRECADLIIDTHSATADQAARAIIDWLENQWPSTAALLAEEPIG